MNKLCFKHGKSSSAVSVCLKSLLFLIILIFVFSLFSSFFRFKYNDGIYNLEKFYELEDDTVDVLVLGSSHAFMNVNTPVLYDEYGIAAFVLGGAYQPMWNTYHNLVEALKTQSPALVILEAYGVSREFEFGETDVIIKNTFGMKPSLNALRNLKASVPPDKIWEYFIHPYHYHTRYEGDLTSRDFFPYQDNLLFKDWSGFVNILSWIQHETPETIFLTQERDLTPKAETYYRKIIELCISKGIALQIVVSPYRVPQSDQMAYNRAQRIAQEYGIPFTNYNSASHLERIGFDYAFDMADTDHLNYRGNLKYTRDLAQTICSQYPLEDRRNHPRWSEWARSAAYYKRTMKNHEIKELAGVSDYLDFVSQDPDYTAFVSVSGYCYDNFEQIVSWLSPLGIHDLFFPTDMNGTWVVQNGQVLRSSRAHPHKPYYVLDNRTFGFDPEHFVFVDGESAKRVNRGLNVVVYDNITQSVIDIVGFAALNDFSPSR